MSARPASPAQYKLSTRKADLALKAGQLNVIKASAGEAYRVLKRAEGSTEDHLASDVVAQRSGSDLNLDYADGTRVTLQDYFNECKGDGGCAVTVAGDTPEGHVLNAGSTQGASLADGSTVMYAHGSPDALASMVPSHGGLEQPLAGLQGDALTYIPQDGHGMGWLLAGLGGAGVVAALAGSGGGGGSKESPAVSNSVKLNFMGGPALNTNDLSVEVYQADGKTKLGTAKLHADGTVTVNVGSYSGVVVVKLINGGAAADYLDEATGVGKDLSAQLYTMGVITQPNSTLNLNVNVLTTIAYTKAVEAAGGSLGTPPTLTAQQVSDTASAISKVFQVDDVLHTGAVATNGGSYNAADGLSAGEKYGAVLAAFSGADKLGSGHVQQTIDTVLAGITVTGNNATIQNATQAKLVEGAQEALSGGASDDDPSGGVSPIIDTYAPVFSSSATASVYSQSGAGKVAYIAAAADPSAIRFSLAGPDAAAFTIDAKTGKVTLTGNPDHATKASYDIQVVATDAAGNHSEKDVTITVQLPPVPQVTSVFMDSGAHKVGDVVTVILSIDDDHGVPLSGIAGTVDGFALSGLTRIDHKTYTAQFTVTEGGVDIAAGQNVPLNITPTDGHHRAGSTYNQAITPNPPIVDNSVTEYKILVDSHLNASDLVHIGFNVTHTFDSDLVFTLRAPDGSEITLISHAGGGSQNFVNTVITTSGTDITLDSGPFTGSYAPADAFSHLTGSAKGVWTLIVADTVGSDSGFLSDWSIKLPDFEGEMTPPGIDAHSPTLSSSTPLDDASGVTASSNLTLTFSENIKAGTGFIKIVNDDNPSDTRTISVTDSTQVSIVGKVVTINPTGDLSAGGHYHVEIDHTALKDSAGNAYAGIGNSTALNFQVAANLSHTLLVGADGVFIDGGAEGRDAGDVQLVAFSGGGWVYTATATGSASSAVSAGTAVLNGLHDGAGHTIAFADAGWSVKFLDALGPKVDLSGFGADDRMEVNMRDTPWMGLNVGAHAGSNPTWAGLSSNLSGQIKLGFDYQSSTLRNIPLTMQAIKQGTSLQLNYNDAGGGAHHAVLAIHASPSSTIDFILPEGS